MDMFRVRVPALPVAAVVFLLVAPVGCDLFGSGTPSVEELPPDRLMSMTAVFEETHESGRPFHRLVLADVENPSNHEILSAAGTDVGRSCFGPEKRRLLFEDNSEGVVGSRAPIKLLDLESRKVRELGATGTLKGCVWRADGSGFYFAAGGGAGLRIAAFYDLETDEARAFAQSDNRTASFPYGRKGRDSILVLAQPDGASEKEHVPFFFADAESGAFLTQIENERLRFVPWDDPNRGGWKRGAFQPAYSDARSQLTFLIGGADIPENIAVTNLAGNEFDLFGASGDLAPLWGPNDTVLFERREVGVMSLNLRTNSISTLVTPATIEQAVRLTNPEY